MQNNIWLADNKTRCFSVGEKFAIKHALKCEIAKLEQQLIEVQKCGSEELVRSCEMFLTDTRQALEVFNGYEVTYK